MTFCRLLVVAILFAASSLPAGTAFAGGLVYLGETTSWTLYGAHGVVVSPDGRHLYVASEKANTVSVYGRNLQTGALAPIEVLNGETEVDGLLGARGLALSADGLFLYVASGEADALAVFARDPIAGTLSSVQVAWDGFARGGEHTPNGLDGADTVALSPDGASLYVAGRNDDALAVFRRDAGTGMVDFVEMQRDGIGDVDGLANVRAVAVSPDGAHVYAAGGLDDAVAVFSRDATTGALTFLTAVRRSEPGARGLHVPRALAVSPDGAHVYVAAGHDDAVTVFARDNATGALTFLAMYEDGVDGVYGLNGADAIAISSDGAHVYVTSDVDQALVEFARDPSTGALTRVSGYRSNLGENGNDIGLGGAAGVAVSPDGLFVYATGGVSRAIVTLGPPRCGDGVRSDGEECDDGNAADGDCCAADCTAEPAGRACASDANGCTDDRCNGLGTCAHVPNTAACDDGAFCTVDDHCRNGVCTGAARDCSASATGPCTAGVCDESVDACVSHARADGLACDDGDRCTQGDHCVAGTCTAAPVLCPARDQCHPGACQPATGRCVIATGPDGTSCDDGDAGTAGDVCRAGRCVGMTAAPDTDGDGILDPYDVCPLVADAAQADTDGDGVGDACGCTTGGCVRGGGAPKTDCLLEFNPGIPVATGRGAPGTLRCRDGDPACDRDGATDGRCTFGVALCFGNRDTGLPRCAPSPVVGFEVMSPDPARSRNATDRANAARLEETLGSLGLEIRRGNRIVTPAGAALADHCSRLVQLVVPASAAPSARPVRRTFRMKAKGSTGRSDVDVLRLECR